MWKQYNPNPAGARVGDCTVRAVGFATRQTWEAAFVGVCLEGMCQCDMPSANHVWGAYLRRKGFKRRMLEDACPDCYTLRDFCKDHPHGVYVVAISGHVVCVSDGDYYDSWDSGSEVPIYYFTKEGD